MKNKEEKSNFFLFLFLIFISLILFLIDNSGLILGVKGIIQKPFLFIEKPIFFAYQSLNNSFRSLIDNNQEKKIAELEQELRQMAFEQNQLMTCLEENEHLRKLLGVPLPAKWKFKMAKVIGLAEKMKINLGVKEEIKEGMIAVSENIYVGKVILVGKEYSLVQLPTDFDSKIPVIVKRFDSRTIQAKGLLTGLSGRKLLLEKVLHNEEIKPGDLVVTSGEEGYLPDLIIGKVEEVLEKETEIYKKAVVVPLVDYRDLKIVFLITY